jgi:hypothetical protein
MCIWTSHQKVIWNAKRARPRQIDVSARRRAKSTKPTAFASGGRAFVEMAEVGRFRIYSPDGRENHCLGSFLSLWAETLNN